MAGFHIREASSLRTFLVSASSLPERLDDFDRRLAAMRVELDALREAIDEGLSNVSDADGPTATRPVSIDDDGDPTLPSGWPPI